MGVFVRSGDLYPAGLGVVLLMPEFPFDRLLGILILVYSRVIEWFQSSDAQEKELSPWVDLRPIELCFKRHDRIHDRPRSDVPRSLQLSSNDLLCALGILFLISTIAIGGFHGGSILRLKSYGTLSVCVSRSRLGCGSVCGFARS